MGRQSIGLTIKGVAPLAALDFDELLDDLETFRPTKCVVALVCWEFRDKLAADIRGNRLRPAFEGLVSHAAAVHGAGAYEAVDWTERFRRLPLRGAEQIA